MDGFLTWGWKSHRHFNGNFYPLPSAMLSKIKKINYIRGKNNIEEKIIWASTVISPYNMGNVSGYDPYGLPDYVARISSFLNALNSERMKSFFFRPRPTHELVSFAVRDLVLSKCKHKESVKFDRCSLDFELHKISLVIVDNPGGVLHKSIVSNVPTIICWNRKDWLMCDEYEEFLDRAKKVNVFFDDPRELASFINERKESFQQWWESAPVQSVIHDFCLRWAQTSSRSCSEWLKFFYHYSM